MNENEIHRKVLEKHGVVFEAMIAAEECGELVKELSKALRWGDAHPGCALPESYTLCIAEEMADVRIKIRQMMVAFGISEADVQDIETKKLRGMVRDELGGAA